MASAVEPVILALERNWEMIDLALEGTQGGLGRRFKVGPVKSVPERCPEAVSYTHLTLPTNREV